MRRVQVMREAWADPDVPLPEYATEGAAGADLRANLWPEDRADGLNLMPMQRILVPTGLIVALEEGTEMQIRPRSGLALKKGLTVANAPGTVDADYRGPVGIVMINLGDAAVRITHGMRVAQAVIATVTRVRFGLAETLEPSSRGAGGFGSTGTD